MSLFSGNHATALRRACSGPLASLGEEGETYGPGPLSTVLSLGKEFPNVENCPRSVYPQLAVYEKAKKRTADPPSGAQPIVPDPGLTHRVMKNNIYLF